MYGILVDNINLNALGFYCVERPEIPAPKKRVKELFIPGRDGSVYIDEELYEDIEINITLNYMDDANKWHEKFRTLKKTLKNCKELRFSDDIGFFRKIKKIVIGSNKRNSYKIGVVTIEFTVDPYYYLESGKNEIYINEQIINNFDVSHPKYLIEGEGICTLRINSKIIEANVGQNITIDTDLMLSFRDDGVLMNNHLKGNYEDMYFLEGINTLSISDGFTLKIIPNWRVV